MTGAQVYSEHDPLVTAQVRESGPAPDPRGSPAPPALSPPEGLRSRTPTPWDSSPLTMTAPWGRARESEKHTVCCI